ncbi:hypothetical protein [Anaerotalea alkaliphila]|uniref:Uncharacterized protein n=1 Tax=Anaerotalea alkaliphila TaxID=2662126 RepID=A0A7X5HXY1_9FIRM|nr:hypothetical protein [Anaerotalea alkaliphila]NDL68665.1 hypothetical protein [Anaerotalea alkaliphila]
MRGSRRKRWGISLLLLLLLFLSGPLFPYARSLAVMGVYSGQHSRESFLAEEGIRLEIPGGLATPGRDWHPLVMTFNDDLGFSRYVGKDVRLSILYNFGAFDLGRGASSWYNPESPYYGGFYGAYAIREGEVPREGRREHLLRRIREATLYDMKHLVLESIGCREPVMEISVEEVREVPSYAGVPDWEQADVTLKVNGPIHRADGDHLAYLQYGKPPKAWYRGEDFPLVALEGLVYFKYFEKEELLVAFYAVGANREVLERTDRKILSQSILAFRGD